MRASFQFSLPPRLYIPTSLVLSAVLLAGAESSRAPLQNGSEVHEEVRVAAANEASVKDVFPSFLEYQDLIMFHPKFGYYGSGRVSFSADYQTYPIVLSPYFGQMITEQIFRMWDGMRRAGTLGPQERFTIAEFGAGDGGLAEQILTYVGEKSKTDARWAEFAGQLLYVCYDRSLALNQSQRKRNARFGKQFDAREADATDPVATIPAGSLKGVVLSNELPDAFSVHKVILSQTGSAEVAFVVPSLPNKAWNQIKASVPAAIVEQVAAADRTIHTKFFPDRQADTTYLSRATFVALMESLVTAKEYAADVAQLAFHEIYVPAPAVPEVADHLRRYAHLYAGELARGNNGVVTYINLGEEKFVQGAGKILGAGYVLTIDYGTNWDGVLLQDVPHLRTYGPAHSEENARVDIEQGVNPLTGEPEERDTSDPYNRPTLNDITTDVNFSLMAAEGELAGLKTAYFGQQRALVSGTKINLDVIPSYRLNDDGLVKEYQSWLNDFKKGVTFKLLVQQKLNTDSAYKYPDTEPMPLELNDKAFAPAQREQAARIEQGLAAR